MTEFNFNLLYVADPIVSAKFYAETFKLPILDQSSTFAALPLRDGVTLGLWARHDVEPKCRTEAGAGEIAFAVESPDAVRALHADWSKRGLKIEQVPTKMSFGTTFVALDPDGHRLRVFSPAPPA